MKNTALFLICAAALAHAQTGVLAGPIAGYVFDSGARSIRPIRGVAGASTLGDPVSVGYPLSGAWIAPHLDSAFGIAADFSTHFYTIAAAGLTETAIPGLLAQPERIVYSPSGSAAALFANGQAQILTGLPASPSIAGSLRLGATAPPVHPTSLALSDDGAYILFAVGGSIQLASQSGGVRGVMTAVAGASVAFAPGGHDAAVAARGIGAMLIHDVPGAAGQQTLTADDGAFEIVTGLAFSADGKRVFAASGAAQSVISLDLSGNRTDIACTTTPGELVSMGGLFRLNELGAGPLWLADPGSAGPRVVFVPALVPAKQAAQ